MVSVKLLICFLLAGTAVKAQTFSEWFDQKNTKKKYLAQQIAALQAYQGVLRTGYILAHHGLGSISHSAKAELNLHTGYYDRLKTASPAVKHNPQVKEIIVWQQDIITVLKSLSDDIYYLKVKAAMLSDCDKELAELQRILSDGSLEMSDAERMTGISRVHVAMGDNYRFAITFSHQVKVLQMQKTRESNDAATLKLVYGNH
jgi:hypothetical protein